MRKRTRRKLYAKAVEESRLAESCMQRPLKSENLYFQCLCGEGSPELRHRYIKYMFLAKIKGKGLGKVSCDWDLSIYTSISSENSLRRGLPVI